MDAERWSRVREVFDRVVELEPPARAGALAAACAEDFDLRAEVESLLAADTGAEQASMRESAPRLLAAYADEAADDERDRLIGQTLGAWRVLDALGAGGMGSVYRGARSDGQYEQQVAIKVLHRAVGGAEWAARFRAERRILAQLDHAYIARLLDGGALEDGTPYLVMEYVEGERIDRWCGTHALGLEPRIELFIKTCQAVQAAHGALIVHRDLKPANILVDPHGEPKLLDFGIAKALGEATPTDAPATLEGERMLTPRYAAPEQIRGERITTATDVYALGVILFELLTGRSPYPSPTLDAVELIRQVTDYDVPPPSRAPHEAATPVPIEPRRLRGDLDAITLKALRKEPERRYSSVEALIADLRRWQRGEPVEARQGNRAYLARKFAERHRLALGVLAVVLLGLAATAFTWRTQRDAVARERDRAESVTSFLLDLFDQADPYVHRGRPPSLTDMVRRGAERLTKPGGADAESRAQLLATLARVQFRLGAFADSHDSATAAARLLEAGAPGGPKLRATLELEIGDGLVETNRAPEAEVAYRRALTLGAGLAEGGDAVRARALRGLARVANDALKDDEADRLLDQSVGAHVVALRATDLGAALAGAKPDAGYEELADTLHMRCKSGIDSDRLDAADLWCRRSLALRERIYPADHPSIAASVMALGRVYAGRREYASAVEYDTRAYELALKTLGKDHPYVGNIQLNTGVDLAGAGRYDEAEPHYTDSIRIALAARGAEHPYTLLAQNNLANLYYVRGDYRGSLALHEKIAESRATSLPATHPDRAQSENNIARAHWRLGELDAAAEHFDRAAAIYAEGKAGPSATRSVRIGQALLALERGQAGEALARARALATEIEAERPDLDGLGACLFLQARALASAEPGSAEATKLAQRALAVLQAEDHTRYLARPDEVEAWLAGR